MHYRVDGVRWGYNPAVFSAVLIVASLGYVVINPAPLPVEIPVVAIPLAVAVGLVAVAAYMVRHGFSDEQFARVAWYGWGGTLVAATIGLWWLVIERFLELPVAGVADQILTVVSAGIGAGVVVAAADVRRRRHDRQANRDRILTETTWTDGPEPCPIVTTIVDQITELEGLDPDEVAPLHEYVGTDVFARLSTGGRSSWQFNFEYEGYEVRVHSRGTVAIYETAQ